MANLTFPPLMQILAVTLGGAIGSVARFLSSYYAAELFGAAFPWGTLFVNIIGSAWLGYIATVALQKPNAIDPAMRLFLTSGFAGGFTTFSSFAWETLALYQRGEYSLAAGNVAANLIIGFIAVIIGASLGRL